MKNYTAKITLLAIILSMALITHYIESMLPSLFPFAPGVKLGLANIFTLFAITVLGYKEGLLVAVLRCVLATFLGSPLSTLAFSLSGAILAFTAMSVMVYFSRGGVSYIGVSVLGSCFHNIGQIIVSAFILNSVYIISYLPVMIIMSLPTGLFIGYCTYYATKALYKSNALMQFLDNKGKDIFKTNYDKLKLRSKA